MLKIIKTESLPRIDYSAINWYKNYFDQLLNQNTFLIRLSNDQIYYSFTVESFESWKDTLHQKGFITATRYLDRIDNEELSVMNIKSVEDMSQEVSMQYTEQKSMIFDSLSYVERIMEHRNNLYVRKAIDLVLKSRSNDESKRKYWRAINEKYYGLDIHPLMEYEVTELNDLLDYCINPESYQNKSKATTYLTAGAAAAGGALIGYILISLIK